MTKRIAFGRIFQETCASSPLRTTRDDFYRMHYVAGDALAEAATMRKSEIPGFLRLAELSGFCYSVTKHNAKVAARSLLGGTAESIETVPLFSTIAAPNGLVTQETFAWLCDEFRSRLEQAGELDALMLSLHGSMQVEGMEGSPEGKLLGIAREILGADVLIAVTLDLHAHITPDIVEQVDLMVPYLTNPHRDMFRCGRIAGRLLLQALAGDIKPTYAWRKLPVALGGGDTIDFTKPLRPIFERLNRLRRQGEVLYASLCIVHPFTQATDIGWTVHVITDNDQARADDLAEDLAEQAWKAAHVPIREFLPPKQALAKAREATWARRTGVVSIIDTGDVTTAGAPGGNTWFLKELLEEPSDLVVYIAVHDPAAVQQLRDHQPGDQVEVTVKGSPGMENNPEVALSGRVIRSAASRASGHAVSLDVGNTKVILTENPPVTIWPRLFKEAGLDPWKADVIVHKTFFHYRWFFGLYNRMNIPMATPGATNFNNLADNPRDVPLVPFDNVDDWHGADRVLRGQDAAQA